jgi:hypothetical protein
VTLNATALARQLRRDRGIPADDFAAFCSWLGVELTPGQAELARVLFDGGEPRGDLGRRIFGFEGPVPMGCRDVVAITAGARSGKSYICISLRMVHAMLVSDLRSLAPGQRAVALVIAPNDKLRREVVAYALGAVSSRPELKALLDGEPSADGFGIKRKDGHRVRFEAGVATPGGYGARGRSLCAFALDETAFFKNADYAVSDIELFRAGSARVLPGCQTIVASTPWAKSGLLYDLHKENWGAPKTSLVAHAPTLVMNPSDMTRTLVAREKARDPENAAREFDAVFLSSGSTDFFADDLIESCVDPALFLQTSDPAALERSGP